MSRQVRVTSISKPVLWVNPAKQISNHYARLLTLWPTDRLRPSERHFQSLLRKRIDSVPENSQHEKGEVNAAYLLLDDTFRKQFQISKKTLRPTSNPDYYVDLQKELEEAPDRSWLSGMKDHGDDTPSSFERVLVAAHDFDSEASVTRLCACAISVSAYSIADVLGARFTKVNLGSFTGFRTCVRAYLSPPLLAKYHHLLRRFCEAHVREYMHRP
nr:hypothetical protein CFP56_64888 [Quercus suber]